MSLQKSIVHLYPVLWTTLLSSPHMQKEQESIEGRARTTKLIIRIKTEPLEKGYCGYKQMDETEYVYIHLYICYYIYIYINVTMPG